MRPWISALLMWSTVTFTPAISPHWRANGSNHSSWLGTKWLHSRMDKLPERVEPGASKTVALGAPTSSGAAEDVGAPSATVFEAPGSTLSGNLSILLWSHFVPSHDEWFDPFARQWGEMAGVNVTVDHINNAEIPGRITAEVAAGQGH